MRGGCPGMRRVALSLRRPLPHCWMSVTDDDVGITAYTTACLGFTGILKHRFRDFQVNEVDPQGNVARLTCLEPHAPAPASTQGSGAALCGDELLAAAPAIAAAFGEVAGPDNGQLLLELLQALAPLTAPSNPPAAAAAAPDAPAAAAAAADAAAAGTEAPAPATATDAAPAAPSSVVHLPDGSVQVLLGPLDSKDTRRAVHAFFKAQRQLPPLVTEAEMKNMTKAAVDPAAAGGDGVAAGAGAGGTGGAGGGASKQQAVRIRVRWHPDGAVEGGGGGGGRGGRGGRGGGGGGRGQKRGRDGSGAGGGPRWEGGHANKYCRFVLYKENMDSQMALGLLSSSLRLGVNAFGYAGTKDKRGVTCQFMTVFMVDPYRLSSLNARLRGVRLGDFGFCAQPLQLGALGGNEFRVVMRGVELAGGEGRGAREAQQLLDEACGRVAEAGFVNYFGLQRFGTGGTPTHKVGGALLRGEFEAAIRMIMSGRPGEKPDVAAARAPFLERGDARASLALMPRWATAERAILDVLVRRKEAGPGISAATLAPALRAVPNTLRMMYLHAYQSYLWNVAASERVRVHGVGRAVAGDLVLQAGEAAGGGQGMDVDPAAEGAGNEGGAAVLGSSKARLAAVHVVTEAEEAAGRWSVHDVVLPLPGSRVQYPRHSTAQVYFATAAADGVDLGEAARSAAAAAATTAAAAAGEAAAAAAPASSDADGVGVPAPAPEPEAAAAEEKQEPAAAAGAGASGQGSAALKSLRAEFSLATLTGDYRHVVVRPKDFEWKVTRYSDPNDDSLALTDLERLVGGSGAEGGQGAGREQGQNKRRRTEGEGEEARRGGPEASGVQEAGQQPATAAAEAPGATDDHQSLAAAGAAQAAGEAQALPAPPPLPPLLALSLRFQLPASCYATMFIRELTKQSTHKDFQAVLSGAGRGQGGAEQEAP